MRRRQLSLILTCTWLLGQSFGQTRESAVFEKLLALSGNWEGSYTWSGGRSASGKIEAEYYTTGNGSAVVEDLTVDGVKSMTSVYHLNGTELRMTHFCAAQNQPRLKATSISPDNSQIEFSMVDITNLRSPAAGHVQDLEVRFLTTDHITLQFRFVAEGKYSDELMDLKRKK
jgi:hypothetical protein